MDIFKNIDNVSTTNSAMFDECRKNTNDLFNSITSMNLSLVEKKSIIKYMRYKRALKIEAFKLSEHWDLKEYWNKL